MKKTIWYMHKPGEGRDYAMTTLPTPEWAQKQHAEGFHLYAVEIDVPTLTPTTGTLKGQAVEELLALVPCRGCGSTVPGTHMMSCDYAGAG